MSFWLTRLYVWLVVIWFGVPFFWADLRVLFAFDAAYPLAGARGLLDESISGLLFFSVLCIATALSIPRYYVASTLFFCSGTLVSAGLGLAFFVDNSGFLFPSLTGVMLLKEGQMILYKTQ